VLKNINIIGCGYIGKKVAHFLCEKNIPPRCFVKTKASKKDCDEHGFDSVIFDLDQKGLLLTEENNNRLCNSVIAYFAPPPRAGETDTRMQHFIATLNSLTAPPTKILLISTTGVYGNCDGQWIDETRQVKPQVARAHRRLNAETALQDYCKNNSVALIIFRVAGIYAADKLPLQRINSGEPIVCAQDSGYTNRIHADDLSHFCVEALAENVQSGIYNCCDGQPTTMHDYFTKVADTMHLARPKEISLQQAQQELSAGMLSYLAESKRISNKKLLTHFKTQFEYPNLNVGLSALKNIN